MSNHFPFHHLFFSSLPIMTIIFMLFVDFQNREITIGAVLSSYFIGLSCRDKENTKHL